MIDVTIFIPNFNNHYFIENQIRFIQEIDSNITKEIIFIDDGSQDNSVSIIKKLQKEYANITLIENTINIGVAQSLNKVLSLAKGKYLCFKALDDLYFPGFFSENISALNSYPKAALATSTPVFFYDDTSSTRVPTQEELIIQEHLSESTYMDPQSIVENMRRYRFWIPTHATMYRTSVAQSFFFDESLGKYCDWFYNIELLSTYPAVYIRKKLAAMRISSNSYSNRNVSMKAEQSLHTLFFAKIAENQSIFQFIKNSAALRQVGKKAVYYALMRPNYFPLSKYILLEKFKSLARTIGRKLWKKRKIYFLDRFMKSRE